MNDPIEKIIDDGLRAAGIFSTRHPVDTSGLDFYLPLLDVYIEVKQFHAPRVIEQMSRVENIIVIQGRKAAAAFVSMVNRGPLSVSASASEVSDDRLVQPQSRAR